MTLKPCPICGRMPKFKSRHWTGRGRYALLEFWFECRKWLGLRTCFRARSLKQEAGHWDHEYWATREWNEMVDKGNKST